jgi:uncharacterized protein (TIGR03083 family)
VNREQLYARIDRQWRAFNDSFDGLPDDVLVEPGVVEGWSVKDLMAHVATWDGEALKGLPIIMQSKRPPRYGGVDNFNARQNEANARLSLDEARNRLAAGHQRLLDFLDGVDESWFTTETRFRHRLRLDTWGHYPEHTQAIIAWRKTRGL